MNHNTKLANEIRRAIARRQTNLRTLVIGVYASLNDPEQYTVFGWVQAYLDAVDRGGFGLAGSILADQI